MEPEVRVAVSLFETREPAATDTAPELDNAKSKGDMTVNDAFASELGVYPLLKALALRVVLLVKLSEPV